MVTKKHVVDVARVITLSPISPIALGAVLRLIGLGSQDLWYDEAFTAWLAGLDWPDMLVATAGDVHPPLWYALSRLVALTLGRSEIALRLPAALLSILGLWLAWKLARAMGLGSQVATVTVWILAISPFQIAYAQESRMYSLMLVAILLGALGAIRRRWWMYALAALLLLYSHNVGALYVLFLFLLAVGNTVGGDLAPAAKKTVTNLVLTNLAVGAIYAPWMLAAVGQSANVGRAFWVQRPTIGAVALTLQKLYWHVTPPAFLGVPTAFLTGLATICALFALRDALRERNGYMLAIGVLAFGPLAMIVAISWIWKPILVERTMVGCTPFLAMLLAHTLVRHRRSRWLALAAVPVIAFVVVGGYIDPDMQKGDMGRYIDPVRAQIRPGDAVLHCSPASMVLLSYYTPDWTHYLWLQESDLSQSLTARTKAAMHMPETTVETLLADHDRVFVYWSDTPITVAAEVDEARRIRHLYRVEWEATFDQGPLIESGAYLVTNRADQVATDDTK